MSSANVYFVEFEQVNIYLRKFDVWSLNLFDSFILIHYDCIRGMVTSFIRYLFKYIWFFVFQMKNEKHTSNSNFNIQLFWRLEDDLFWYFLSQLLYRNENQTLFLISHFNLSKKTKWHFGYTESYERALNFDELKIFSENYKPMKVWSWIVYKFTENYCLATFLRVHLNSNELS